MKTKLFLFIATIFCFTVYSQTPIPVGPIYGTWTLAGSPYLIEGETTIPNDSTLTIEAGVYVEWQGSYTMHVQGQILAEGTETDTITFTAADTLTGWNSMKFFDTPAGNDTSSFAYCTFQYGRAHGAYPDNNGGAIATLNFGKIIIDHCYFHDNQAMEYDISGGSGAAISLHASSPLITNNTFQNNSSRNGGGILCYELSNPLIQNNLFINNSAISLGVYATGYGGGICCVSDAHPDIINNTFCNNYAGNGGGAIACVFNCNPTIKHNLIFNNTSDWIGGGIELQDTCSPDIINNTIAYNFADEGGGIDIWGLCEPQIKNTILWGNEAPIGNQVNIKDEYSEPDFNYSDIQGGQAAFGGFPHTGDYEECIDSIPLFEDTLTNDYHLTENSPCIDKGHQIMPDPDNTPYDIGAYYFDQRPIIALDATEITVSSFIANWEEAEGATAYLLDVSIDPDFNNFMQGFHDLDVGIVVSYLVEGLEPLTNYYYRIRADYYFGRSNYSDTITVFTVTSVTDTEYISNSVNVFPNPFTSLTTFEYVLNNKVTVNIEVYNSSGQLVQRLFNDQQEMGEYQFTWDTSSLPNGIYFVRLQMGYDIITKKIVRL